ncbi:MAG: type II toxin-antitoxin system Phd/YefM family antitoxin [Campylobacterota bacterium]|nr:type II toxin-antitoxin system Phd/YefM family antitoxin [Campylobacterota bacterium]
MIDILDKVQNFGETFVIEYGKKHKKVAKLVPYEEEKKVRVFGQLKGKIEIYDNFDDEDKELNDLFYNGKIFP